MFVCSLYGPVVPSVEFLPPEVIPVLVQYSKIQSFFSECGAIAFRLNGSMRGFGGSGTVALAGSVINKFGGQFAVRCKCVCVCVCVCSVRAFCSYLVIAEVIQPRAFV